MLGGLALGGALTVGESELDVQATSSPARLATPMTAIDLIG